MVVVLLVAIAPAILAVIRDPTVVIAILVFLAVGLAVGHVLGGPNPNNSVVLALSTACRHPAIALSIAAANFPEERFDAVILLYLILGAIAAVPYLAWHRRRSRMAPLPTNGGQGGKGQMTRRSSSIRWRRGTTATRSGASLSSSKR